MAEAQPRGMTASASADWLATRGLVRLRTLVLIRWVALAGQAITLVLVHVGLGYKLPIETALAVVGLSVLVNLAAGIGGPAGARLSDRAAALFLGYDLLQLAVLLSLTGGLYNPFAILILAPVAVSATILSRQSTIGLCVLAVICLSVLATWHKALPWNGPPFELPRIYVTAIWSALVIATVFIGAYAWRLAEEARKLADALAATQMALAREHRLSALGGLAAAAAHELGSPLSTIAVIAKEIARDTAPDSPIAEDIKLLLSQSERCREILAGLTRRPEAGGGTPYDEMPLSLLVEAAAEPHERDGVELIIRCLTPEGADADEVEWAEPTVQRRPELLFAIGTLIQNAVQFARNRVEVEVVWGSRDVALSIVDNGPGFPPDMLERLGEPYVSSRSGRDGHMGLGIFIAKTLLEGTGAALDVSNVPPGSGASEARTGDTRAGGARVAIHWQRGMIEIGREAARAGAADPAARADAAQANAAHAPALTPPEQWASGGTA